MNTRPTKQQIKEARKAAIREALTAAYNELKVQIDAYRQKENADPDKFSATITTQSKVILPKTPTGRERRTTYFENVELKVQGFQFIKEVDRELSSNTIQRVVEGDVYDYDMISKLDNLKLATCGRWPYHVSFAVPTEIEKEWLIYITAYPHLTTSLTK